MACKYIRSSTGSIGAAVSFKRAMSAMHAADGIPGSPILHRVLSDQNAKLYHILQTEQNSESVNGQDRASLEKCGKFVYI
jgi:hypothetical protein